MLSWVEHEKSFITYGDGEGGGGGGHKTNSCRDLAWNPRRTCFLFLFLFSCLSISRY